VTHSCKGDRECKRVRRDDKIVVEGERRRERKSLKIARERGKWEGRKQKGTESQNAKWESESEAKAMSVQIVPSRVFSPGVCVQQRAR
jgi:hypothetical protein